MSVIAIFLALAVIPTGVPSKARNGMEESTCYVGRFLNFVLSLCSGLARNDTQRYFTQAIKTKNRENEPYACGM